MDRVFIQISTLAPFVTYEYMQYQFIKNDAPGIHKNRQIHLKRNPSPNNEFKKFVESGMQKFCEDNELYILEDQDLRMRVEGVSLELSKDQATVFNFFFDDESKE
ncbi:MAG TPA: hypothetical protein VIU93_10210 [Gallionellaceae bacterium]